MLLGEAKSLLDVCCRELLPRCRDTVVQTAFVEPAAHRHLADVRRQLPRDGRGGGKRLLSAPGHEGGVLLGGGDAGATTSAPGPQVLAVVITLQPRPDRFGANPEAVANFLHR